VRNRKRKGKRKGIGIVIITTTNSCLSSLSFFLFVLSFSLYFFLFFLSFSRYNRDLKPENILLMSKEDDTGIKIADFGFAARIGSGSVKQQAGTPGYVSPEVLERKAHGKPVDMWAMGVVLYMLLAGYPPFYQADEDPRAMYRRILTGNYQFHPEYWSAVSPEAKDLITGLLTVDPTARLTVDQVLAHPWLKKSKEELSLVILDRTIASLRDYRAARAVKLSALAAGIAIDVARKFSGANLSRTNLLNDVAVDVIRKLSNSNINELAAEARKRQQSQSQASTTSASPGPKKPATPSSGRRL
jgi:serine/threonine protein kinase